MKKLVLFLFLLTAPAGAEEIMSAQEFEAYTSGKTLYFSKNGKPFGAEQYLTDRSVVWYFLSGQCERGAWFAEGDQICFVYETQSTAQCWYFLETEEGKRARVAGADPKDDLLVEGRNTDTLNCPGPGVGVNYLLN